MKPETNQMQVVQALAVIGPMSNYELQLQLNLTMKSVANALNKLREKDMVRIVRYEEDRRGNILPFYAEGAGGDAPRPDKQRKRRIRVRTLPAVKAYKNLGVWAGLMR